MSIRDDITVLILSYNEEANIDRTLSAVRWARRILIVDSGSTDRTLEIMRRYPQVEVVTRAFDGFASQCNFGLSLIASEWVLSLDADYELSAALSDEILRLEDKGLSGYAAHFIYRIYGYALRGSLYPPRTVLYRRERATYRNEGHGHRVVVAGEIGVLAAPIYHDDRKPLTRWFASQQRYARAEADNLLAMSSTELTLADRLRLLAWPMPIVAFLYALMWNWCLLDGWPGWFYAFQRALAEIMIALEIIDRRLRQE